MNNSQNRALIIIMSFLIVGLIYILRLFYIQVVDDTWKLRAEEISFAQKSIKPARGLIFDRNGEVLVATAPVYNLLVTPNKILDFDTLHFCKVLGINKEIFLKKIEEASTGYNKPFLQSVFEKDISPEDFSRIAPLLVSFKGFEFEINSERYYPASTAPHILGYIREVSQEFLDADTSKYYRARDKIGINGIESFYERELRGERGLRRYLKDSKGKEKKEVDAIYAISGKNLYSTIDKELQTYGELLMANKIGSIVAIDPSTGEILAMVSAPTYNPNDLTGRDFTKHWNELLGNDSLKPLINRAVYNDSYRPGSIFKLVQSLVALEMKVIDTNSGFACLKSLIGCHNHPPAHNIKTAIQHSCNPYFYQVYKRVIMQGKSSSIFVDSRLGLIEWNKHVASFGLGTKLGTDIPGVKKGRVPDTAFYDRWYGKNRWAFSTIYSNSIGEGELGVSPLQMANLAAIIANRGYYYTPHLVRKISENGTKKPEYLVKRYTTVDQVYFQSVVDGMEQVVLSGTGRQAQVDSVSVCGKTGTVQNESFNDHSVFIAFAPKDNPKIAIAVYVEYGTWGGTWAAPIASLMIEKYLKGEVTSVKGKAKEERALKTPILDKHAKF
ncbi:MAG: peptidoglycan D,D-transpeptidase FtsI family protein [Bacteroidia bacterium]